MPSFFPGGPRDLSRTEAADAASFEAFVFTFAVRIAGVGPRAPVRMEQLSGEALGPLLMREAGATVERARRAGKDALKEFASDRRCALPFKILPPLVGVRRRHVLQRLMQPAVVVVLDEAPDRLFEFPKSSSGTSSTASPGCARPPWRDVDARGAPDGTVFRADLRLDGAR